MLQVSYYPLILMEFLTSFILILTLIICFTSLLLKMFLKKETSLSLPPGPKGIPIFGSLPFLDPELHSYLADLSKTYGPIFSLRIGNKLSFVISSPSVAQEILKDKDTIFANREASIAAKVGFYGGCEIVWSPYGPEWRMLRKICTQAMLTGTKVDSFYEIRKKEVRKLVNNLWIARMSPVDVRGEILNTLINLLTTILWGDYGDEVAKRSLGTKLRLLLEEMEMLMGKPNVSDFIPSLAYFDLQGIEKQMKGVLKKLDNVFELMIDERIGEDENEKIDFLQILLNLRKGGVDGRTPLSMTHLKSLLLDMIVGGTNTTLHTIEFALAEMMNNSNAMKKAQNELDIVVGTNNRVEESHLHKLPYLHAIMHETLRLHPSGPLLGSRFPSEPSIIGGYTIPKGTHIFINIWAIHRDPSIWEDPLKFDPERFMKSKWDYSGKNFNYFPFGSGRRICMGIQFAEKSFMILLATLIHSFEWKVPDGETLDLEEKFGFTLKLKKPLVAIPTPRLSNKALYE